MVRLEKSIAALTSNDLGVKSDICVIKVGFNLVIGGRKRIVSGSQLSCEGLS